MRSLSSAYHHNVLSSVCDKTTGDLEFLKTVVLSSREMSHSFSIFMERVPVFYSDSNINMLNMCTYTPWRSCGSGNCESFDWLTCFVRNLHIRSAPLIESRFLKNVLRANWLQKLEVINKDLSANILKNLSSICRHFAVNAQSLGQIKEILPCFDTIVFNHSKRNFLDTWNPIEKNVNLASSSVLCLRFPYATDVDDFVREMDCIQGDLKHLRRVHFTWDLCELAAGSESIKKLMNCALALAPNVEKVTASVNWSTRCFHFNRPAVADFWSAIKDEHTEIAGYLSQIPHHIKIKLDFVFEAGHFQKLMFGTLDETRESSMNAVFKPDNFYNTFCGRHKSWTVANRRHRLTDNVEFSFQCRVKN